MIDDAVLATELNTDPNAYGYATLISAGNHGGLADLLNLKRAEIPINRGRIPVDEIKDNFAPADFAGLDSTKFSALAVMLSGESINVESQSVRTIMGAIFPAGSTTRANLVALVTRDGSRAEQLFGSGVVVSHFDVAQALGG